jgi:hypothetical protein
MLDHTNLEDYANPILFTSLMQSMSQRIIYGKATTKPGK